MSNQNCDPGFSKGVLIGAILGGAIGAVTALLFAPKSGEELRKDIADKSSEIYDKTSDYMGTMQATVGTTVSNTVNEGKIKAQSIIDSARAQAENLLANAESALHDAKEKAGSAKGNVKDRITDIRDAAKASADVFKNEMTSSKDARNQEDSV